jgi:hypothetical protein
VVSNGKCGGENTTKSPAKFGDEHAFAQNDEHVVLV